MAHQPSVARAGRLVATGGAVLMLLAAAACGGDDQPSTQKSASATPSSPATSQSPTPTPSASPTTAPLSRFEDLPVVQGTRAWAVAYSTDINNRDRKHTEFLKLSTARAGARADFYEKVDLDDGGYEPGPVPFTPVAVKKAPGVTYVYACVQYDGWAINRKTKQPIDPKRTVRGSRFHMIKTGGTWKFDELQSSPTTPCGSVVVKGVPWSSTPG